MKKIVIKRELADRVKISYTKFSELQNQIVSCKDDEIHLYINTEKRLGYTFVFLLSTLPFLAEKHGKIIRIFCNKKNYRLFQKLGFLKKDVQFCDNHDYSIELFRKDRIISDDTHIFKIVTEITTEAPVKMSPKLSCIFISKAGEMYNNAKEHSEGSVFGAKFFKNRKNEYCFSCYDNGVGIPDRVLSYDKSIGTQLDALKWAMLPGNSTAAHETPRGLGLSLLRSFAQANDGRIRICTGNILYTFNPKDGEKYNILNEKFYGTLFEMDIIADNNRQYIIK